MNFQVKKSYTIIKLVRNLSFDDLILDLKNLFLCCVKFLFHQIQIRTLLFFVDFYLILLFYTDIEV